MQLPVPRPLVAQLQELQELQVHRYLSSVFGVGGWGFGVVVGVGWIDAQPCWRTADVAAVLSAGLQEQLELAL